MVEYMVVSLSGLLECHARFLQQICVQRKKKIDVYCRVLASVGSTAEMLLPLLFYRNISLLLIHLKTAPFTGLAIRRSETLIQEGWKGK